MKFILFLVGIIASTWVAVTIYSPVQDFVVGVKKVYLQSKVIERSYQNKSDIAVNALSEGYREISRIFGVEVAEKSAKEEITTPTAAGAKDPIENLFQHDIALWISVIAGFLTLSLYLNILSFIAFFLKPVTFFMK